MAISRAWRSIFAAILAAASLLGTAHAQYPSPTYQNLTVLGTFTQTGTGGNTAPFFNGTGANPFRVGGTAIVDSSRNATFNTLTSTVATGTAPFTVSSTTNIPNLNASLLSGNPIGTSGATVPLLNGTNTWSALQTFSGGIATKSLAVGASSQSVIYAARYDSGGAPTAAGTNYTLDEVVTLNTTGGTCTTAPKVVITFNSANPGPVTGFNVLTPGACTVWPTQPMTQASTTGTGSGATFTLLPGATAASIGFSPFSASFHQLGTNNLALGTQAGGDFTITYLNTALGNGALGVNTIGVEDTAIGALALERYTGVAAGSCGAGNTAIGVNSQGNNLTGCGDVSLGTDSVNGCTVCTDTIGIGNGAVGGDIGNKNIGIGSSVMAAGTTARTDNIGIGRQTLFGSGTSSYSRVIAMGDGSLFNVTGATRGVYIGDGIAGGASFNGADNVIAGSAAGNHLTGNANDLIIIGSLAAFQATTPVHSIIIGDSIAGTSFLTNSHVLMICTYESSCDTGSSGVLNIENIITATGTGTAATSATTVAGTIAVAGITTDATHTDATVCEDTTTHQFYFGSGTLGVCLGTSSLRYKTEWKPLGDGLQQVMALKPGNYFYKPGHGDNGAHEQYGFLAEDMIDVLPKLTGLDADGKPNSVDILGMVPVLVKAVQQQQSEIDAVAAHQDKNAADPLAPLQAKIDRQQVEIYVLFAWLLLMSGFIVFRVNRKEM